VYARRPLDCPAQASHANHHDALSAGQRRFDAFEFAPSIIAIRTESVKVKSQSANMSSPGHRSAAGQWENQLIALVKFGYNLSKNKTEDPDFYQRFMAEVEPDRMAGLWEASEDQDRTWRKDFDLLYERAPDGP
jgi:hypothetical protein